MSNDRPRRSKRKDKKKRIRYCRCTFNKDKREEDSGLVCVGESEQKGERKIKVERGRRDTIERIFDEKYNNARTYSVTMVFRG